MNKILALLIIIALLPIFIFIYIFILLSTFKNPLYFSKRIGKNQSTFFMPKFRTMKLNTPQLATHLLNNSENYLYFYGPFLRKSSLDELPQLLSIIKGDLNFIGPRPALFNQKDLINSRKQNNILTMKPGITGLAQVMGRDELTIQKKVEYEIYYKNNKSFYLDIKIILLTFKKILINKDVLH